MIQNHSTQSFKQLLSRIPSPLWTDLQGKTDTFFSLLNDFTFLIELVVDHLRLRTCETENSSPTLPFFSSIARWPLVHLGSAVRERVHTHTQNLGERKRGKHHAVKCACKHTYTNYSLTLKYYNQLYCFSLFSCFYVSSYS